MLKWVESTDRSGDYKYMHTPLCTYEVRDIIGETVDIEITMKPVYNFKAGKD